MDYSILAEDSLLEWETKLYSSEVRAKPVSLTAFNRLAHHKMGPSVGTQYYYDAETNRMNAIPQQQLKQLLSHENIISLLSINSSC